MIKIITYPKKTGYDSIDIRFEVDGEIKGYGFTDEEMTYIALQRCPICDMENYAANVLSGRCTWCPFIVKDTVMP